MKQKKGLVTEKMPDGYMIVPTEGENIGGILTINESGGFVWKLLEKERDFDEIISLLVEEYGISRDEAEEDLTGFLKIIGNYIE